MSGLHALPGRAKHIAVTVPGGQDAGSAANAASAWKAVRDTSDIQFAPLPPYRPPPTPELPEWLKQLLDGLGKGLEAIFRPLGKVLGMSWPVFQYVLIALGALLALYLLWHIVPPLLQRRRAARSRAASEPGWTPDRTEAVALLEEADRLAAQGRYGEAVHLLLQRSVRHIADARPDWLQPASTAREIAGLALLPEPGRHAFGVIASRVERCLFALRELDAQDWSVARQAYADFARVELRA